jgi:hypothetical protein
MERKGQHPSQQGKRPARLRRAVPLAAAFIVIGLLAAACSNGSGGSGGPGVAGAGSPSSSASSSPGASAGGAQAAMLAYSHCMRDHGIWDFPDPDANGGIDMSGSDLDPDSPQFQAAQEACKSLLPARSTDQSDTYEQALRFAKCMRDHGISDFPDPEANGEIGIQIEPGTDLDPNNPQFKAAAHACQSLLPAGPGEDTTQPSGSGSGGGS